MLSSQSLHAFNFSHVLLDSCILKKNTSTLHLHPFIQGDLFNQSFIAVHKFIHSFIHSSLHLFIRSSLPSFLPSFLPFFLRSFILSFFLSFFLAFFLSFFHSLMCFIRSFLPSLLSLIEWFISCNSYIKKPLSSFSLRNVLSQSLCWKQCQQIGSHGGVCDCRDTTGETVLWSRNSWSELVCVWVGEHHLHS